MADITPEQIVKIADKHIAWFQGLIDNKSPHANVIECKAFLSLWQGTKAKGGKNLSMEQLGELHDAISSGEYDDILLEDG